MDFCCSNNCYHRIKCCFLEKNEFKECNGEMDLEYNLGGKIGLKFVSSSSMSGMEMCGEDN